MFLICLTGGWRRHWYNDINTAADFIYGVTGDYEDFKRTAAIMGNMTFDDHFETKGIHIWCYADEEAEQ